MFEGKALTTVVPSGTTFRDNDAATRVGAPGRSGCADTLSAVVVIVGAFLRNEDASIEDGAEAVGGKVSQTLSASVVGGAAHRDLHALVGGGAETEAGIAVLVALGLVSIDLIALHTVATLVMCEACI